MSVAVAFMLGIILGVVVAVGLIAWSLFAAIAKGLNL
jgi:hypothetical protein